MPELTQPDPMPPAPPSDRTRVLRKPERGAYDRATIDAILDAAFVCHLTLAVDGQPSMIPTLYGRVGDRLYVHGLHASRTLRSMRGGIAVAIGVTIVDGLVLARSAFNHSMNYRSVIVFGHAHLVRTRAEKLVALRAISEHVLPGRWDDARPPNDRELKQTLVLAVPLDEASAKVRGGPPIDDPEDLDLPIWAGVVPLRQIADLPQPADERRLQLPAYLETLREGATG